MSGRRSMRVWSKTRGVKTTVDGITFDSLSEARRYEVLKQRQDDGEISQLKLQPQFDHVIDGTRVGYYRADFSYVEPGRGVVIEDVKGADTALSRYKRKVTTALYKIPIVLIEADRVAHYHG